MNKRGAEMTIGTIIVIILALVVLVVIIYGFTVGWGNLWQRITGFSPKADVSTHVQSCQLSCTTESKADYCRKRDVLFEDKGKRVSFSSCEDLQAQRGVAIGLEPCPSIDCTGTFEIGTCAGLGGKWQDVGCTGTQEDITTRITNSGDKGEGDEYCCRQTCSTLGGIWSETECDPNTQDDRVSVVTDKKDGNENNWKYCCILKPSG